MTIPDAIYSIARKAVSCVPFARNAAMNLLGIKPNPGGPSFAGLLNDVSYEERSRTAMHRAFYENIGSGVHKWRHYLDVYDRYLSRYCGKPVKILEIGVWKGGSMAMLASLFRGRRKNIWDRYQSKMRAFSRNQCRSSHRFVRPTQPFSETSSRRWVALTSSLTTAATSRATSA